MLRGGPLDDLKAAQFCRLAGDGGGGIVDPPAMLTFGRLPWPRPSLPGAGFLSTDLAPPQDGQAAPDTHLEVLIETGRSRLVLLQ
jgi:hypothetical protein